MTPTRLTITIDPELRFLLSPDKRRDESFSHVITCKASIKDVIESLSIPHTEIGTLLAHGHEIDFAYHVQDRDEVSVQAPIPPVDVTNSSLLRPVPAPKVRFLVDANVGRLARLLRMVGLDTAYNPDWHDPELAQIASEEKRILLTRDRALLKRACVDFGRLVRASCPEDQLAEVIRFYGLQHMLRPFSRCMRCNGLLAGVDKQQVDHMLEPLTRVHYDLFYQCDTCGHVYWEGSHKEGMKEKLGWITDHL